MEQNSELDWSLVAEMVFESEAASYEITGCGNPFRSYAKAGKAVEKITGLDLSRYYQEVHQQHE